MSHAAHAHRPLATYLAKLERRLVLPDADRDALLGLPAAVRQFDAQAIVVDQSQRADCSIFLVDGLISRQRRIDGAGQILSISVPGDAVDLQTLFFRNIDHALVTHMPTTVASVSHAALIELCDARPFLAKVLWHDTLVDSAIFREWAMNVGHRRAPDRIGAFLLEMEARLAAIGQAENHAFQLPLTQQEIASALGLSLVHMNKSLRRLRDAKMIATEGRTFRLLDKPRLMEIVRFDGSHLHVAEPPAFQRPAPN